MTIPILLLRAPEVMGRTSIDLSRSARPFDRARISGLLWIFTSNHGKVVKNHV